MGEMCVTYGAETKKGAVENPEEQILLEDTERMALPILKEEGGSLLDSEEGIVSDFGNEKINVN